MASEPEARRAAVPASSREVSVIVPTWREAENIPHLVERVRAVRAAQGLDLELLFVDDDSRDGSVEAVERFGLDWARIIVRTGDRGLARAVIEGFRAARGRALVCMDCDLSHPPEAIPKLLLALGAGQQFAIGSRYVPGGSTDDDWGPLRWLNSLAATLLARPLTSVRDPMSGFFALRKADFDAARGLDPVGYKIGLELIVKCGFENVAEIPIRFADRTRGESKLTFREQLKYLQHLRRLYLHEFGETMHLLQFMAVGAIGAVVNLTVLTFLQLAGAPDPAALAGGIGVSLVGNFLLNRRFTFSYAKDRSWAPQFLGFLVASAAGMAANYGVALWLATKVLPAAPWTLQTAAICGIGAGMGFNFLGNRYLVFRKRWLRR